MEELQWTGLQLVIETMPLKLSSRNTKTAFSSEWTTDKMKVHSIALKDNSMKEMKWWHGNVIKVETNGSMSTLT
jgi:hypothetical protein